MSQWRLGLRIKSTVALILVCLVALVPAGAIGLRVLDDVRGYFGEGYARNFTLLNREKILAPVSRELALSQRLADSVLVRRWLSNEDDSGLRALVFEEAEGYRRAFQAHGYFLISALSHHYYFNGDDKPYSDQPRYSLSPEDPADDWFFRTLEGPHDYNINVDPDVKLGATKVWINV